MKRARLRPQAEQDLVEAARYYSKHGGSTLGQRFFDAALSSLAPIRREPSMGSPRLGQLCEIPGLRSWRVQGFPVRWLYFEREDHLDIVRLLGERQDIVPILSDDD